jgi:lysophospholipase L1-like esterase
MWRGVPGCAPRRGTPAPPRADRRPSALAVAAALVCAVAVAVVTGGAAAQAGPTAGPLPAAATDTCAPAWVAGWHAAAQPVRADPALAGGTLRMVVSPQVAGARVRVRLSNAYGTAPLVLGTVSAAGSDGAAGLVPGSVRRVSFAGRPTVVVPAGAEVVSDPVPLVAEAGRPLAVSLFLPGRPEVLTQHPVALQTSYLSQAGDVALAPDGGAFDTPVRSWLVLAGVEVLAPRPVNAVVTVGDSITDGVGSGPDADERWSDALSRRLHRAGGSAAMAVLNAGISRNRLLVDNGVGVAAAGDPPSTRFERDVAAVAGATDVVLHIGTNDIAAGRRADEIIGGLQRFAHRARAAGKRVFLTTITPSRAGAHGTPAAIATREAVNAWVLAHGREHGDGVFDFAAAVADPARPSRPAPVFDSGDGLHLSAAGYRALAAAVDIGQLTGSPCLDGTTPVRAAVRAG